MEKLLEEQRENWGTRGGFVLAAVGSAVGLGNLWGFPYKIYSHGGGAFLIPYIIAMFVMGIPMLILEFSLGHFTQRAAPEAFRKTEKKVELVGWWGILLGFIIIMYYPIVLAWCFTYLGLSVKGIFNGGQLPWVAEGLEGVERASKYFFSDYLQWNKALDLGGIQMQIFWPLLITWAVMYLCICKGVSLVGKIVWITVPLPWLMLLILTIRGLTLDGAIQGLAYYLTPDWSRLLQPETWTYAFGQAFFSLSLAFGVMITYASFLHRKSDINNNAAIIGIADFATSFIAGIAVFATLGGMAFVTQQAGNPVAIDKVVNEGPGLAFVAFPYALAQLPYSAWFSFVFFFALVTLGVDSGFSITESVLASIVDKTGWKRSIVLPVMSVFGLAVGLIYITNGGLSWLATTDDYINGTWGIALLGLLECTVLGWMGNIEKLRKHANSRSDWKVGKWWNFFIRIVIPVILGCLFFWNLFGDITEQGGFWKNAETGEWILPNVIGMSLFVGVVPILSIVLSIIRSPLEQDSQKQMDFGQLKVSGRGVSIISLIFSLIGFGLCIFVFFRLRAESVSHFWQAWLLAGLLLSVSAIAGASAMLDKYDVTGSRSSWKAKWAGFVGVLTVGAYAAVQLINYTRYHKSTEVITKQLDEYPQELTVVSYIILAFALLVIMLGLAWCILRALSAAGQTEEEQKPGEE